MGDDIFVGSETHTVLLDGYYMDAYEVTNALYKACVDASVCVPPTDTDSASRESYYGNAEFDNYPVLYVNWNMAKAYCEWRGARLPTEAEWEKAARGEDGRKYPWGGDFISANGNFSGEDTTAVGSYEGGKSPYGIYDMSGNAQEWVADWYSDTYYLQSPQSNPLGPETGEYRVVRGGPWASDVSYLTTTTRTRGTPDDDFQIGPGIFQGFRCVRSIP